MKMLVILGSRNPAGQTASAAEAMARGFASAGGQADRALLPTMDIRRCRQCDENGWGTCITKGLCALEDDFAGLVERIAQADVVVFATPVYFGDLSESMRALLDRLRRTCMNEAGKKKVAAKPAVGICVAGGGGGGSSNCAASLEGILRTCGFEIADMVPVRRQNLQAHCETLTLAGRRLAETGGK